MKRIGSYLVSGIAGWGIFFDGNSQTICDNLAYEKNGRKNLISECYIGCSEHPKENSAGKYKSVISMNGEIIAKRKYDDRFFNDLEKGFLIRICRHRNYKTAEGKLKKTSLWYYASLYERDEKSKGWKLVKEESYLVPKISQTLSMIF